jgi:alpha-D-ribose 1-methylphosphonate 5-triphosphate synthase subunit PhnH
MPTATATAPGTALAGFADPVRDAQACFRAVLEAMSRPGRVQRLACPPEVPPGLSPAAAALLLTLVDADTRLALAAGPAAEAWVRFHCGAALVPPAEAGFVLDAAASLPSLDPGTEEEPERGATLLIEVVSLAEAPGWRLTGPGIRDAHNLRVVGAPPGFLADWAASRARFPRGIDVILCAGEHIAALPRGVGIEGG